MTMYSSNEINKKKAHRFTLRMDPKTQEILEILQDRTSLSKAGIFRLALINFYNQNVNQDSQINKIKI